jgi:hypothetical protein
VTDFVDNVVDDEFFSVFKRPLWDRKPVLRGIGAASFIGSNFGFRSDGKAKELGSDVGECLDFI